MRQRMFAALLVSAAALAAPPVEAQDEPPFLEGLDTLEVETPPFRLQRPSDSWMFLDLAALERQAEAQRLDTSGYRTLKARLWLGASRANIYVHVTPDPYANRATPPTAQELAAPQRDGLVRALLEGRLEGEGAVRVGQREGWSFEVHGRPRDPADAPPVAILRTLVYRVEDRQIFQLTLEGPLDRAAALKRDYAKLLRKARL